MSKRERKSGNKKPIEKLILATAIIELIKSLVELINKLLE